MSSREPPGAMVGSSPVWPGAWCDRLISTPVPPWSRGAATVSYRRVLPLPGAVLTVPATAAATTSTAAVAALGGGATWLFWALKV